MSRIASTLLEGEAQFKRRKVSISDRFLRKLKKRSARKVFNKGRNGKLHRVKPFAVRKPLKKLSRARRNDLRKYFAATTAFLLRPENYNCSVCVRLRERGHNILLQPATETHHKFGRIGRLLCYEPGFIPCCRGHREWIHDNPKLSREMGVLCAPAQWNVYPD